MTHESESTRSAHEVKREFEDTRSEAASTLETHVREVEGGSNESLMVRDVMTAGPVAMESDSAAVEAARAMVSENVGSLPVVSGGTLVGMVTDRDLVVKVLAKDLDANKVLVSECCTDDPIVASPDESLDAALQRMAEAQVRRLPVVEDERLVGIVAQADVARAAGRSATGEMVHDISMG
jgi:CBS domain-containing protein